MSLTHHDTHVSLQDCVASSDIRLSVLVNTGRGGGIASVRGENMVCRSSPADHDRIIHHMFRCDPASCQCFHAQYERDSGTLEDLEAVSTGQGEAGLMPHSHSTSFHPGYCDDRCILFVTLGFSLLLASVLLLSGLWGRRLRLWSPGPKHGNEASSDSQESFASEMDDYNKLVG